MRCLWFTDCSIRAIHHQRLLTLRWKDGSVTTQHCHTAPASVAVGLIYPCNARQYHRGVGGVGGGVGCCVFGRCHRRMLMMESVGGYAHQLRDTHPPLVPRPSGCMMQTPPSGIHPALPLGKSRESQVQSLRTGWMDGWIDWWGSLPDKHLFLFVS